MTEERRAVLSQAGLLGGHVAPLLDHGLLHHARVGPHPAADLLGDVAALLHGLEARHQLGHVLAHSEYSDDASMIYAEILY